MPALLLPRPLPTMADESREIRKNRAIQRLRSAILVATLLALVVVVALLVVGREDGSAPPADELDSDRMEPTGELVTVGEGFERTFSERDVPVFTVRGDRYAVDREGVVFLEGVHVTVYREEGEPYEIEAPQARFDIEEREGRLAGGVRLAAPGELELTTAHLQITHGGKQVRSRAPVDFLLAEAYEGHAQKGLRAWLEPRRFLLEGYVKVVSLPSAEEPLQLEAEGLILDRSRNLVRSRKWAFLRRRGERISSLGMELFFAEDQSTPRFVRAVGNVQGFLRRGPGGLLESRDAESAEETRGGPGPEPEIRRLSFRSDTLTLLLTEDGRHPARLDLEGRDGGSATLRTLGPPGSPRHRLTAPAIGADFAAGEPTAAQAGGGVVLVSGDAEADAEEGAATGHRATAERAEASFDAAGEIDSLRLSQDVTLEERAGGATLRRATAERAEAAFDAAGEIETFVLEEAVTLADGEVKATGDRGVFRVGEEVAELVGRPAVAVSERGRMEAPRILYTRETGLLRGTGGVRVRLQEVEGSALGGSPLARGDGPVWIEAEEGYLRDQPRAFLFVGEARAWRGEDLLVAEELRGDEPEDRLTATGGVRTLWTPEEEAGGEAPQAPLEVVAKQLVYRRSDGVLVYTGDVVAEQERRTVACDELVVELAEGGGIDELICTGNVRIDDPAQGKSMRGERAVYDPGERTVDVTAAEGGKVTVRDREGNVIEGPRMKYFIDEDRVRVLGRDGSARRPGPGTAPAEPPHGPAGPGPGAP